ncbi:PQ-loop domain-containing transporter [Mesomycoplasma lagogenitalium]|uniref:PQ-loop domain-containing transporter n=1 Tax=Mesomycoplasma lagogenitalium TaxID=171286 RepID=A0ABY8LX68_9BACT|nr:PQ-loop domain-containing transporter [Mesomycoplasma lagogenitalium]WGI36717.1 PQ-loop domain-containing transporter [Mesomycoplasma lagogenitalium]
MDIFNFFTLNNSDNITFSSAILSIIFGIIACLITASLGIPQLISILKEKKTGNVNYISYWIFYIGCCLWIIFGCYQDGTKLIPIAIANIISVFTYNIMMIATYQFDKRLNKREKTIGQISSFVTMLVFCLLGILGLSLNLSYGTTAGEIITPFLAIVTPMLTTFAFIPVVAHQFKTKDFSGMSKGMSFIFVLNNVMWNLYWIFIIVNRYNGPADVTKTLVSLEDALKNGLKETETIFKWSIAATISTFVWQTISLIIYSGQFTFMLKTKNRK